MSEVKQKKAKPLQVRVVSDKMNKSRVGVAERLVKHARYDRYLRKSTRLMFHDEANSTKVGDVVLITPSRPLSAQKKFTLLQVVKKFEE